MGISMPRNNDFTLKAYDVADPWILYVIRVGNGHSCSNVVDAMMVKASTADSISNLKLLYISNESTDTMHYWFAHSSSSASLGQIGTSTEGIVHYKLTGAFQCSGSVTPFMGTMKKVTNTPSSQAVAGSNKYVCFPDASISSLCQVVDMKMAANSAKEVIYVANTNYHLDAVGAI